MKITEAQLRKIVKHLIACQPNALDKLYEASARRKFIRFGDPRNVPRGISMIHDPDLLAYSEEPGLFVWQPGASPPRQKFEQGISAYPVVASTTDKIVFRAPIGIRAFIRQLDGFLFDRFMNNDVWIFTGQRVPNVVGTDDEPLVKKETITSTKKIDTDLLWVTDLDTGDANVDAASAQKMLDIVDPWTIWSRHDMGYDEFFRRKNVTLAEIEKYILNLRKKFVIPKQIQKIDMIERLWLDQWEEDHTTQ